MDEMKAFAVLGVPPDSPFADVHQAYCRLCRLYGVENDPSPEAAMRYREVGTAYAVLKGKFEGKSDIPPQRDHGVSVSHGSHGGSRADAMADLLFFEARREKEEKRRRRIRFLGALCGSLLLPILSGSGTYLLFGLLSIPATYLLCSFLEQNGILSQRGTDEAFFSLPCLSWFLWHLLVSFEAYRGDESLLLVVKLIGRQTHFLIIAYFLRLWLRRG